MNAKEVRLLVRTCITYGHLGYLNLEDQELICLYDECLIISQYFGDISCAIQLYMLLNELRGTKCFETFSTYIRNIWKAPEMPPKKLQNIYEIAVAYEFLIMAKRYELLYNLQRAIECCEKAINTSKNLGIKEIEAKEIEGEAYEFLAVIFDRLYKYHEMTKCSENCVKIGKETGKKVLECYGYLHLGSANLSLGKWNIAISCNEEAIEIALQMDDKELLGVAYTNMGLAYKYLGKLDQAQRYLEKSLKIQKEIGNRGLEATCYANLGIVFSEIGKYQEAMDCYEKGLSISKSIDDKEGEGFLCSSMGHLYWLKGRYHKAIQFFEKGLKIFKHTGDRMREGEIYRHFSAVYYNDGKVQESLENLNKSLKIAIETGDKVGQILCYLHLGTVHQTLKKYNKSLEYFVKCLKCAREIDDKMSEGNANCCIGSIYLDSRNPGEAIKYLEKGLNIAKSTNDKEGEGYAYCSLGDAYFCMKKYEEAIRYLEKSLNVAMNIDNKSIAGHASNILGSVYYNLSVVFGEEGDKEKCEEAKEKSEEKLKEALQCSELEFTHLKDLNDYKLSIVDRFFHIYEMLTKVLVERQKVDEALLISDRGRARSLGDILVSKYGITEERAPSHKPLDSTGLESVLTSNQFCILFFAMGDKDFHAWVLTHQKPIVFVNIKSQVLFVRKALNEFYYKMNEMEITRCENRSFDESTEDLSHPNVKSKFQSEESLIQLVERNVDSVGEPQMNVTEEKTNQLEVLFSLLVTPVIQHLQQEEIVIIPDGPLYMLPFSALRDPTTGKYLSETKSIRISPSLTTLKSLRECSDDYHSKTGALIVGDPDVGEVIFNGETKEFNRLPSAEREAIVLGKLWDVTPLIGSQATKEMVKKKLREGVAVIHIAAHGDSEHGHIALAPPPRTDGASIPEEQDYMLTMEEVQEIGVTAQLVVLSCCHSGRGDIKAEGVVGMSRAFLAAGARAVVASLWAIDDEATLRFMSSFYASIKMGESASKSLQIAMDDIRAEEGYEDPMYWAPFFLIGDDVTIIVK